MPTRNRGCVLRTESTNSSQVIFSERLVCACEKGVTGRYPDLFRVSPAASTAAPTSCPETEIGILEHARFGHAPCTQRRIAGARTHALHNDTGYFLEVFSESVANHLDSDDVANADGKASKAYSEKKTTANPGPTHESVCSTWYTDNVDAVHLEYLGNNIRMTETGRKIHFSMFIGHHRSPPAAPTRQQRPQRSVHRSMHSCCDDLCAVASRIRTCFITVTKTFLAVNVPTG